MTQSNLIRPYILLFWLLVLGTLLSSSTAWTVRNDLDMALAKRQAQGPPATQPEEQQPSSGSFQGDGPEEEQPPPQGPPEDQPQGFPQGPPQRPPQGDPQSSSPTPNQGQPPPGSQPPPDPNQAKPPPKPNHGQRPPHDLPKPETHKGGYKGGYGGGYEGNYGGGYRAGYGNDYDDYSDDYQYPVNDGPKPGCPGYCNPHWNKCHPSTSCTYPSPLSGYGAAKPYCACRPGYRSAYPGDKIKNWRVNVKGKGGRLWVAEGVGCEEKCDDRKKCEEVAVMEEKC